MLTNSSQNRTYSLTTVVIAVVVAVFGLLTRDALLTVGLAVLGLYVLHFASFRVILRALQSPGAATSDADDQAAEASTSTATVASIAAQAAGESYRPAEIEPPEAVQSWSDPIHEGHPASEEENETDEASDVDWSAWSSQPEFLKPGEFDGETEVEPSPESAEHEANAPADSPAFVAASPTDAPVTPPEAPGPTRPTDDSEWMVTLSDSTIEPEFLPTEQDVYESQAGPAALSPADVVIPRKFALGTVAIILRALDPPQVAKVLARQHEFPRKRFGELAVELGFLTDAKLEDLLSAQREGVFADDAIQDARARLKAFRRQQELAHH